MDKLRSYTSTRLFKLAQKVYPAGKNGNPLLKEVGNMLFKLAAVAGKNKDKKGKK